MKELDVQWSRKDLLLTMLALVGFSVFIYGLYYIGKSVSYSLFYEDMVLESIKETVKRSCIK